MDRNGIAALLLLFLMVSSNADLAPQDNSTAIPVSPSPIPGKESDAKPNNATDPEVSPPPQNLTVKENNTNPNNTTEPVTVTVTVTVSPPPQNNTDNGTKNSNNTDTDTVSPPPQRIANDENNNGTKKEEKSEDTNSSVLDIGQNNCIGTPCRDEKPLLACIESFETGSNELAVLVKNEGEETLEVNLTSSSSDKSPLKELKISQHHTERINISLPAGRHTKLILNAGHGECVLHLNPSVSEETFFLHLPSYDKLVTPINGAYFLILIGIIFGGTWACCKFRKRRRQGGVPYQELEMGLPESVSAADVETAEGWDQGWDDDWDGDNAVKSPGGRHVGSISANGLTSRSLNRDGWENDWDD